jgi:TolB-like protein
MPLSPNQRLGSYEIVCTLGAGGMGEVYRARDERLGRDVALKILPPEVTNEAGRLERFDREARAIAALNHPNIVTIYSTEHVGDIRFLTMELVDGCTLSDLVMPAGMALPRFLEIAIPFADALAAAHQKQITHRDLKPGNVMVSNDGRVKVLDFGLARIGGGLAGEDTLIATQAPITNQGTLVGTMPYMSPEQVEGNAVDARSDLFSVGVIFYELLSGERPFKGGSSPALMSAILRDTPPAIDSRRADLPESLARLVDRLLEKRPEDRWQTARDVYNELRHAKRQLESGSATQARRVDRTTQLSVRVLPFTARSVDGDAPALAEGLPEEISNGLSRFGHLRVLFGAQTPGQTRYSLDGQIRAAGSSIRISVKLIDVITNETLWSQNFDRQAGTDFFKLQDDVASRVVTTVGDPAGVLARAMLASIADLPIDQLSVAELVIRYHAYTERFNAEEHAELRDAFERALQREPRAAEGWACLAQLYRHEHSHDHNPLPDSLQRQRRAAARAVELDANSQLAWVSMASAHLFARDGVGVRMAVDRAIELNPLDAVTFSLCALYLSCIGEHGKAVALATRAVELKPLNPSWLHVPAFLSHFARGEYGEALRAAKAINIPRLAFGQICEAAAAGMLGKVEEARTALRVLREHTPNRVSRESAREAIAKWVWDESLVDRIDEGYQNALALMDSPQAVRTKPPSSHGSGSSAIRSAEQSIAVLPFSDLSEKKDQDWFCDGIAEEIMNALGGLPGLRVAARASAFSFRGKADDLESIGDKLNVDTVLEGSVRRAGDRVRITTRLSDTRQSRQLWSERFDREMKDIFDIQEEIARAIAERLRIAITGGSQLVQRTTTNMEAYELLLKGRALVTRRGRAILDAIPLFERAIALDPNVAEAHALLGDAHRLLGLYGIARASEMMPKARACVERALAIDPSQAEALATLAIIATVYLWDFGELRRRSDRTLAADPNHVRGNTERALSLGFIGQPWDDWQAEVETHIRKARTLDPLNAWVMASDAAVQILLGRLEEGTRLAKGAIDLDGNNFTAHWYYTWGLAELGLDDASIAACEPALAMSGRHALILSTLSAIHASRGQLDAIEPIHAELAKRAGTAFVSPAARATVAASAGRFDDARRLLAEAIAEHDPYLAFFKMYGWRPIWKDEQCAAMIRATSLFQRIRL